MQQTDAPAKPPYHHGNLVEALIAATVALIEEKGVEAVSVREAARRAGVSPGAPFRHFRSKTALLTAVAEQAMDRFAEALTAELAEVGTGDPIAALSAMGRGYLAWASANPTHFQIISSRALIDFEGSEALTRRNVALRAQMTDLIVRGQRAGQIRTDAAADTLVLSARAFIYGLARMQVDGHFPEWQGTRDTSDATQAALDLFIAMLRVA